MSKHINKTKKKGTNFDLTTDSLIEKYLTILIKLKNCFSQPIVKILLIKQSGSPIRHCLTGNDQI